MNEIVLNTEIIVVLGILILTIILFVFELIRVDLVALAILVLLGLTTLIPGLESIADADTLFSGFSSNAVMSIIAVMIIGAGLDRTGVMHSVSAFILKIGGHTERRITATLSASVGILSGFMQNVGAAALFIPVVSRVSSRAKVPASRIFMPMGFSAILGGTLTLIGSSPLIMLNDLLPSNIERFEMFDVTPIGLALIATGILFFALAGRFLLPVTKTGDKLPESTASYFSRVYQLNYVVRELIIDEAIPFIDKNVAQIEKEFDLLIIVALHNGELDVSPPPNLVLKQGMKIALMSTALGFKQFEEKFEIDKLKNLSVFKAILNVDKSGISELVIPVDSNLVGKKPEEISLRRSYGLSVLAIHRGTETLFKNLRSTVLQAGDTLICHSRWSALVRQEKNPDLVIVTSGYPREEIRNNKIFSALLFFSIAMGLVLFTDLKLALALMVGAVGMILSGVLSMNEAYKSISWKTIFLLAGLLPLGAAVQHTGTAAWIANKFIFLLGDVPGWVLQGAVAILATVFSLVMSNVGATVLLVPLAMSIAISTGNDPRMFALTVAIATSNAFLIPTHQVNALIMGPGGYRVKDFISAGGVMSVLFLIVLIAMLNLLF